MEATVEGKNDVLTEPKETKEDPQDALRKELWTDFREAVSPVEDKLKSLEDEKGRVLFSRAVEQADSKLKLIDLDILRLSSDGKFEEADQKKREREELKISLQQAKEQQAVRLRELDEELERLKMEKKKIARRALEDFLYMEGEIARAWLTGFLSHSRDAWAVASGFATATGCKLSLALDKVKLGIECPGDDRQFYQDLRQFIKGE